MESLGQFSLSRIYYHTMSSGLHAAVLVHRHYFAMPTNPGEQFYLFTSLAAWLIRKAGRQMEPPQEYDDPNSTVSSILDHLRQLVRNSRGGDGIG